MMNSTTRNEQLKSFLNEWQHHSFIYLLTLPAVIFDFEVNDFNYVLVF